MNVTKVKVVSQTQAYPLTVRNSIKGSNKVNTRNFTKKIITDTNTKLEPLKFRENTLRKVVFQVQSQLIHFIYNWR
jgi:hypothetical protein